MATISKYKLTLLHNADSYGVENANADSYEQGLLLGKLIKGEDGGTKVAELTQAEYDALSEEDKMNGTVYFIKDAPGAGGGSLPSGGTTGQVLTKKSNTDGDVEWKDAGGGELLTVSLEQDGESFAIVEGYDELVALYTQKGAPAVMRNVVFHLNWVDCDNYFVPVHINASTREIGFFMCDSHSWTYGLRYFYF